MWLYVICMTVLRSLIDSLITGNSNTTLGIQSSFRSHGFSSVKYVWIIYCLCVIGPKSSCVHWFTRGLCRPSIAVLTPQLKFIIVEGYKAESAKGKGGWSKVRENPAQVSTNLPWSHITDLISLAVNMTACEMLLPGKLIWD